MDVHERHLKIWKLLRAIAKPFIVHKFNLVYDEIEVEGPCIVIPNHVSNWDPILLAAASPKHMYFVASEHIFRWGLLSRIIEWLLAPIARKKASVASDTIRAMLRHVKDGHSVCIFGEGKATWNGISNKVLPATGKMVRSSGATLVTYKIEGGYLTDPRWGKKLRRGRVYAHPVNVYSPQQLRAMSPEQINDAINADIYEDAWERQRLEKRSYKSAAPAVGMERGFFLCPRCRKIGTLRSSGSRISCSCGFELEYTDTGFLSPQEPFETLAHWDKWQHEALLAGDYVRGEKELFSDTGVEVGIVGRKHRESKIGSGTLRQLEDRICVGQLEIPLSDISHMDMVNTHKLFVKTEKEYYQIKATKGSCLRKYLAIWKKSKQLQA